MSDAVSLLQALLERAERAMLRAQAVGSDETAAIEGLTRINAAAAMPAPDGRLIGDVDMLLAQAVLMLVRARLVNEERRARGLAQVVGVLIPLVREHAHAALMARARLAAGDPSDQGR